MAHVNRFEDALDKMFKKRTYRLRSMIGTRKPGPSPKITKKFVKNGILDLQEIASNILADKLAKSEFDEYTHKKRAWHIKGHGVDEKKRSFEAWFQREFPNQKDCIYVFWGDKKCIYVGRTGGGGSRPSAHFNIYWFKDIKRVDIYPSTSASQKPKLECLAIHHFEPMRNKKKSATKKWTKKCPLCTIHENIEKELLEIFRLR